nr:hypothetical protein CFP56_01039 [Quercus suber]
MLSSTRPLADGLGRNLTNCQRATAGMTRSRAPSKWANGFARIDGWLRSVRGWTSADQLLTCPPTTVQVYAQGIVRQTLLVPVAVGLYASGCDAGYICADKSITSTYDHRRLRTGHPVRSAIHKQSTGELVVRCMGNVMLCQSPCPTQAGNHARTTRHPLTAERPVSGRHIACEQTTANRLLRAWAPGDGQRSGERGS